MTTSLKDFNLNSYNKDFEKGNSILQIDLKKVAKNYLLLSKLSKPGLAAAVVKADAYGCGVNEVCPILSKSGCNFFFPCDFLTIFPTGYVGFNCERVILSSISPLLS